MNITSSLRTGALGSLGEVTGDLTAGRKHRYTCGQINAVEGGSLTQRWEDVVFIFLPQTCDLIGHRCLESESESEVAQSCPTLCDPVDCSPPGSSVHGILQAKILEWVAISFSRGSSHPRDQTRVPHCGQMLYHLSHQGIKLSQIKKLVN